MGLKHSNWITAGSQPQNGMVLAYDASLSEARMRQLSMPVATSFTQPAVGGSVNVTLSYIIGVTPGQTVHISNTTNGSTHGYYNVDSVNSTTNVVGLTRLAHAGTSTSTSGTIAANTSLLTVAGRPGVDGAAGATGATITPIAVTTNTYTQPAVNATVSVSMNRTDFLTAGMIVVVGGLHFYSVSSVTNSTTAVLTNLGYIGSAAPGASFSSGLNVGISGRQGPTGASGAAGASAPVVLATTSSAMNVTAIGNTGLVSLVPGTANMQWIAAGMILTVTDGNGFMHGSIRVTNVDAGSFVLGWSYLGRGAAGPIQNMVSGLYLILGGMPGEAGAVGAAGATGATGATGPAGPQIPGLVRGATEQTRSSFLTTLNQNLPSGFYTIYPNSLAQAQSMGTPLNGAGGLYVIVNHHENGTSNSDFWQVRYAWQIQTNNRWFQEVTMVSGNPVYGPWQIEYNVPTAMSSATWQARAALPVFINPNTGILEKCSLGALKWMLGQSTTSIPSQGGTPTSAFSFDVSSYFVENTDVATYAGSTPIKTYSVVSGPANLTINSTSGVVSWPSPTGSYSGTVTIGSTDVMGETVTNSFVITISAPANNAPVLPDFTFPAAPVGLPYYFELPTATDSDGPNALTYSLTGTLPDGLFYTNLNGVRWISGTPRGASGGTFSVTYSVTDGTNTTSRTKTLTIQGCSDYRELTEYNGNTSQIIWELVANTSSTAVAPDGAWRVRRFQTIIEANQRLALGQFNFDFVKVQNNSFTIGNRVTGSNNPLLLAQNQNPSNYPSEAGIIIISQPLNGSNQIQTYNWVRVDSCGYIVEVGTHTVAVSTTVKVADSTNLGRLNLSASLVNGWVKLTNNAHPGFGYYKVNGDGEDPLYLTNITSLEFEPNQPIVVEWFASNITLNKPEAAQQIITLYDY
jgi:hypothetical protein